MGTRRRTTARGRAPARAAAVTVAALIVMVTATLLGALRGAGPAAAGPAEQDVPYRTDGDPAHVLDVYKPATPLSTTNRGGAPAVVTVHGGGWAGGDKKDVAPTAQALADAGFVVFNVNYDTADDDRFPRERDEVADAVRWVQDNAGRYGVDRGRIGLYGSSAGGNLVMLVATTGLGDGRPPVRAVVSWSGPSDLATISPVDGPEPGTPISPSSTGGTAPPGCDGDPVCLGTAAPVYLTAYLGCTMEDCPWRYREASPLFFVSGGTPPMFLAGAASDLVPFSQNREMGAALSTAGVGSTLFYVEGLGHAESLRPQAMAPTTAFLRDHVAGDADGRVPTGTQPVVVGVSAADLNDTPIPQPPAWVANATAPAWWRTRNGLLVLGAAVAVALLLALVALVGRRRSAARP